MRTGVVVVTYNSAGVIGSCLDSCGGLPVVVVDNASTDETCREVRERSHVQLISNATNRGFAGAVNQGVAAHNTELILLLNPDVRLETSIGGLETACSQDNTAAAAGQLRDEQGNAQAGFALRRFPTPWSLIFETLGINRLAPANPVNRRYRCLDADLSRDQEAEQPAGAFLLFRRDVWQQLGGFDTQFAPVWFEDVDFCRRVHNLGMKIQYVASVTARHQGGHSVAKLEWACRELCWYASLLKYASKHYRPYAYRGVSAAVVLASTFRAGRVMVRERSFRPITVYARIARLAGRSCLIGRVDEIQCWTALNKRVM